jgi:glycosyltransferase involved in cell wall biosynthesis
LIEALYCGVPVVATDCPSGPREILSDGKYGVLVPVRDVEAIAAGIDRGIRDDLPRPPEECWRPYELGRVTDRYLEVLLNDS